jgi:hypothetical protein
LFDGQNLHYDFAVVHLAEPFVLGEHIDIICLPDLTHPTASFIGDSCVVTGWGKDKFGD